MARQECADQMKLGIVGSSFSVGNHNNPNVTEPLALPFEHWFNDIEVYNAACASKGTELYLSKVVYLKKRYDIDTLLMESVNNRSMLNVKSTLENYQIIKQESNIENIVNDVLYDSDSMYQYQRYLHQHIDFQQFGTKKSFNHWIKFQEQIATDIKMNEFWAMVDMSQTIDLCNMLGIKVVCWAHHWHMEKLPSFNNMIKNHTYIKFGNFMNAIDYYSDKYGKENIICDSHHFNDSTNKEMVSEFIRLHYV